MARLTREQILAAEDLKSEEVPMPEWGGSVLVRMMTGGQRDIFGKGLMVDGKADPTHYRAKLLSMCVVGDDGKPMFSVDEINSKSNPAVERLFAVADRINAINAAAVEDAEKN